MCGVICLNKESCPRIMRIFTNRTKTATVSKFVRGDEKDIEFTLFCYMQFETILNAMEEITRKHQKTYCIILYIFIYIIIN